MFHNFFFCIYLDSYMQTSYKGYRDIFRGKVREECLMNKHFKKKSDNFAGRVLVEENKDNFCSHIMFRKLRFATWAQLSEGEDAAWF